MERASSRINKQRKSRLKRKKSVASKTDKKSVKKEISDSKTQRAQSRRNKSSKKISTKKLKNIEVESRLFSYLKLYIIHLPTLFLALIISYLTYLLITNVSPESIKHFLVPNTYLPLLILAFTSIFFLSSYILLNTRKGLTIASIFIVFLFLSLQQVLIDWKIAVIIILPFVLLEITLTLVKRTK